MDEGKGDGAKIERGKKHFTERPRQNKRAKITRGAASYIRVVLKRQGQDLNWDTRPCSCQARTGSKTKTQVQKTNLAHLTR